MRISFDLDDTLILSRRYADLPHSWGHKMLNREWLREGTVELLHELQEFHELWVYTSSNRPAWMIWLCFRLHGIRLKGIVNDARHRRDIRKYRKKLPRIPTKYPPMYKIDLHIDDAEGVAAEGRTCDFPVIQVEPGDSDWVFKVERQIDQHHAKVAQT